MASVGGRGYGEVTIDQAALDALIHSPAGPVAKLLTQVGQETTQVAKRNAPVGRRSSKTAGGHPSGWLRSNIGWALGTVGWQKAPLSLPGLSSASIQEPAKKRLTMWARVGEKLR